MIYATAGLGPINSPRTQIFKTVVNYTLILWMWYFFHVSYQYMVVAFSVGKKEVRITKHLRVIHCLLFRHVKVTILDTILSFSIVFNWQFLFN